MMLLLLSNYYGNVRIDTDDAIYKGHFVDANSVHWLDPTHNVFGLGLTTYIHILDEEEKEDLKERCF